MNSRDLARSDPAFVTARIVSALSMLTGEYGTVPVLVAVTNWITFVERSLDAAPVQQSGRNGTG